VAQAEAMQHCHGFSYNPPVMINQSQIIDACCYVKEVRIVLKVTIKEGHKGTNSDET